MKYALCDFGIIQNGRLAAAEDLTWKQGRLEKAKAEVEKSKGSLAALFFPADIPGIGYPLDPEVSRETFEKDPARHGVCYYLAWSGYRFE